VSRAGLELEIKLGVSPERIPALRRHPALRGQGTPSRWQTHLLVTTYHDTATQALRRAGMTLRVRHESGRFCQTVKREDPSLGAVFARGEWEAAIPSAEPDLAAIPDPALRKRLEGLLDGNQLRRVAWGRSVAEVALDRGTIIAGNAAVEIAELELELLAGDPADLISLAAKLAESVPVTVATLAKSVRGYALLDGTTAQPPLVPPLAIPPEAPAAEAFRLVLRHCLHQAFAHEPVVRASDDPEGVHQMRVALRRLRSAIGVFRPALDPTAWAPLHREISWIAGALGPARDWDVFVIETAPPALAAFAGNPGMAGLTEAAAIMRVDARAAARQALTTPRYVSLMLALSERCLPGRIGRSVEGAQQSARALAAARLARRHRSVVKGPAKLRDRSLPELHELRIRVKKLRYTAGFFISLFPGKPGQRYLAAAAALQQALGHLNDAGTAHALLDRLLVEHPGTDRRVAGMVEGWVAAQAAARQAKLDKAWRRFRACRRFWPRPEAGADTAAG